MKDLEDRARAARAHAYAPYSKFAVGAAVRAGGQIYAGVNVENAAYPLGVCAERNAIAAAVLGGARAIDAICVCTGTSPPASPCGGCRQALREFAADPSNLVVVAINDKGERRSWTLAELLPDSFSGKELP